MSIVHHSLRIMFTQLPLCLLTHSPAIVTAVSLALRAHSLCCVQELGNQELQSGECVQFTVSRETALLPLLGGVVFEGWGHVGLGSPMGLSCFKHA